MRLALVQIDPTIGDLAGNRARIVDGCLRARAQGARLAIFPEMALVGYPARDLLESPAFLAAVRAELEVLAAEVPLPAVVGFADVEGDGRAPIAVNAAAAIGIAGQPMRVFRKTLLPTYDVFDEARYFRPRAPGGVAQTFTFEGVTFGVSICEDMWNLPQLWPQARYTCDPIAELAASGAQVILNLSASPYAIDKQELRFRLARDHARRHGVPFLYANLVGGNDELIFDGASFAIDARGDLAARAAFARDDLLVVDVQAGGGVQGTIAESLESIDEVRRALVLGVADYAAKCRFRTAVLGLSGGIDSAVVAALACEALGPENVTGITMPSRFSSRGSVEDSRVLAANLRCRLLEVSIERAFGAMLETVSDVYGERAWDTTEENLQARIRGAILMAHSNKLGSLVLSTGNKSELAVGYCTLYGDMCGGLAVISDLTKGRVYALARAINAQAEVIPTAILDKAPSAELRPNQTDQDTLPPYALLDEVLIRAIERGEDAATIIADTGIEATLVRRILDLVDRNEYKRWQMPPGLRVTPRAFGGGRRYPIARR